MLNRDEIIGIALKVGFPDWWLHPPEPERQDGEVLAMLGRFAALVEAAEREACAQASEQQIERWVDDRARYAASECAAAIRARSST